MTTEFSEWRAQIRTDIVAGGDRLVLARRVGTMTEVIMPDGTSYTLDPAIVPDREPGLILPRGAWQAIVDLVAPKANEGEISVLKEALNFERLRVDRVLERLVK